MSSYTSKLKISITIDNNPCQGLRDAWGVGYFIETDGDSFIFDTGPDPDALRYNVERMGVELGRAGFAVLSHEHGDHSGGFPYVAEVVGKSLNVYLPASSSLSTYKWLEELGLKPVGVKETLEVSRGVYVLGEVEGPPWEVAVAVRVGEEGVVLLTGCGHPGAEKLAEKAVEELGGKLRALIGGLHLKWSSSRRARETLRRLVELGVEKIYPIHCSGDRVRGLAERELPQMYGGGHVGLVLEY